MKRATYNNMLKVTNMIANKGYEWNKANEIAINCFANAKETGRPVEFFISMIRDAD